MNEIIKLESKRQDKCVCPIYRGRLTINTVSTRRLSINTIYLQNVNHSVDKEKMLTVQ